MPYKIVLLSSAEGDVLAERTVECDKDLKAQLHALIQAEDFWSGNRIVIMSMTDVDVANEKFWNELRANVREAATRKPAGKR